MSTYHVYPVGDLREHQTDGRECWCRPTAQDEYDGTVVVHNAMDRREKYETGELKAH